MELSCRLLDHPFYQAWNRGEITREQLADYAAAYQVFMEKVPALWDRVLEGLDIDDETGDEIVAEETEHVELWAQWRRQMPAADDAPQMTALFQGLDAMDPSELAGALHAYEVQQPEVAETKKDGLMNHYGVDAKHLDFFDEHAEEEEDHILFGKKVRNEWADTEAFDRGFQKGAELVYNSLDNFV
jgi:pyrroloquinoline-quinone synthase